MVYMTHIGVFWVAKEDVYKILAKEINSGILAFVFETIIPDS